MDERKVKCYSHFTVGRNNKTQKSKFKDGQNTEEQQMETVWTKYQTINRDRRRNTRAGMKGYPLGTKELYFTKLTNAQFRTYPRQ